jgi:ankyrin repeat protein
MKTRFAIALAGALLLSGQPATARQSVQAPDVLDAVLALDEARLRSYLQRGWGPDWKVDSEGSTALHALMMVCERNRSHDRDGVVRIARLLVGAGAGPAIRNKWNDTPLIIAMSPRYCGPGHPVVAYLRSVGG